MNNILTLGLAGKLFNLLDGLYKVMPIILGIGVILFCLQCFFGYRIFKFLIGVQGFFLFGIIGMALGYLSFSEELDLCLIMGLIIGGLGALVAMELYEAGVFFQCFGTGSIIGVLIGILMKLEMEQTAALAIVLGIIIGMVGVMFIKPLIILSTGFSGGMSLGCIIALSSDQDILIGVLTGIIVSMCGIFYQFYPDKQSPNVTPKQDNDATI